ncbi:sensor histidine kinase [Streptomyces sp. H27-D2]|uniref:sensor histidine kinase n=1 Tax=Streptomyces sp. H27-D2 TaxID=3046304 RepID=UPI002DBF2039|nr:ATP-binding protein [Streptomyces sp. H27-D2]MEC4016815.1 ATP-binding protein [Streptomyces sp. H27-D2]
MTRTMTGWRRLLPRGERARLTALYGGLLVLAGAILMTVVYVLVRQGLYSNINSAVTTAVPAQQFGSSRPTEPYGPLDRPPYLLPTEPSPGYSTGRTAEPPAATLPPPYSSPGYPGPAYSSPAYPDPSSAYPPSPYPPSPVRPGDPSVSQGMTFDGVALKRVTRNASDAAEHAALNSLLTVSGVALLVFALVSVALAWWMAGRVLRPVGVITASARRLSGENLHERIGLKAPPGELKELADTFDAMLGRIEQLVSAQQRFAANAAHELRTPLAVQRAAAEIGLAGEPDPRRVARIRDKLIEVADDSEHLIEGLLLLSVSDQGLQRPMPTALDEIAVTVTDALAQEAAERGLTVETSVRPLTVQGDAVLLDHLVHNLVGNAIRYNHPGGTVWVGVGPYGLEVSNTGPGVPPEAVPHLFEPFRRVRERRHAPGEGAGLGLSIVASIARAHGARATATASPGGGLTVRVAFRGAG